MADEGALSEYSLIVLLYVDEKKKGVQWGGCIRYMAATLYPAGGYRLVPKWHCLGHRVAERRTLCRKIILQDSSIEN